jgi:uncharacterized coiled-coil DUF342 family protein
MNNQRRKEIKNIINELYDLKEKLETLKNDLESVCQEEDDCYNNLPESIMYSERGDTMQQAIDAMDSAFDDLDTAYDSLGDCITNLEEIE